MVSIITPYFNASKYLQACIESVLTQDYSDWELILVDDGSTDNSTEIAKSFQDERIKYFKQPNQGVSVARNLGLSKMSGDFFCFLDADDLMTQQAITSRLKHFNDSSIAFVGGGQQHRSEDLKDSIKDQLPTYNGNPRKGLVTLDDKCFINCGTWLIRRDHKRNYSFPINWTHSEDLAFFLSISDQGELISIHEIIQIYRRHDSSAMTNLHLLENGYWSFYRFAINGNYLKNRFERWYLKMKIKKIMTLSYLAKLEVISALKLIFK